MKLSIIIIGDEILIGQVTDTNSGVIARMLGPMGWEVVGTSVVGDDAASIRGAIDRAMEVSDLVITTGGLGPTKDDITKHVLTEYFGGEMVMDESVTRNIEEVFAKRGLKLNELTRLQAMVPSSCRVLQNVLGTAPIMWFERDGRVLVSMPGVPFETEGMMRISVIDAIKRHFAPDTTLLHRVLMVSGITESDLAAVLAPWEDELPAGLHLAYLPTPGYIRLRLDGVNVPQEEFDRAYARMCDIAAGWELYRGDASPARILLELLRERGLTVASAESCTGGNIAHSITMEPGSSDCYLGSVVSYSNDVKSRVLGVPESALMAHGAVSEPVVMAMARGVAACIGADCSMATSGVAGPGGGTPDKPVGTVWIAVHTPRGTRAECCHFPGSRARVIERATTHAILMLISELKG